MVWADLRRQVRTTDFYIEWSCTALSAFGAYSLAYSSSPQAHLAAWAAWFVANVVGAAFAWRSRHYGLLVQFLLFMPSSLKGITSSLGLS